MMPDGVLSIAAHGDPSQTEMALRYPEQCECRDRPIYDRKPRQRFHPRCAAARRRAMERRKYRENAAYRAARRAKAATYYQTRRRRTA